MTYITQERAQRILGDENKRIESILLSKAGLANLPMAKQMALYTALSADEAVTLLNRAQRPALSPGQYIFTQEAKRIESIINSVSGQANIDMAKHVALNTSMNPQQAIEFLETKVKQERASMFMTAMSFIPNPEISAGSGEDYSDERDVERLVKRAVSMRGL